MYPSDKNTETDFNGGFLKSLEIPSLCLSPLSIHVEVMNINLMCYVVLNRNSERH